MLQSRDQGWHLWASPAPSRAGQPFPGVSRGSQVVSAACPRPGAPAPFPLQPGDCRPGGVWLYPEPPRSLHKLFGSAALQMNTAQQQLGPASQPCPQEESTASTRGAKPGVHLSSPQAPAAVIPPSPSPCHCAAAPAGGCPKPAPRASSRIAQGLGSASANSTAFNPFCPVHAHRLD